MATVRRAAAFGAAFLGLTTMCWPAAAEPQASAGTTVRSVWTLTTSAGRSVTSISASAPGAAATGPIVQVHRRVLITFRVAEAETPPPLTFSLPANAGRYAAYFFPKTREGVAALRDPASSEHWPAVVMFGAALSLPTLYPDHRYQLAVATDQPAPVRMPVPMRILSVRNTWFPVTVLIHRIQLAVDPAPALAVSLPTPTGQGRGGFNAVAVALNWNDDRELIGAGGGSACLSRRRTPDCSDSASNAGYFEDTGSSGPGARPAQRVYGVGYDHLIFAPYIDADGWHAPTGFDAATAFGFGMNPTIGQLTTNSR